MPIRIMLVDHDADWLNKLSGHINLFSHLKLTAATAYLNEAIYLAGTSTPDIICFDPMIKNTNSFYLAQIFTFRQNTPLLMVSSNMDVFCWSDVVDAGIKGCVAKEDISKMLVPAIEAVCEGEFWFSHAFQKSVEHNDRLRHQALEKIWKELTNREKDICLFLISGVSPIKMTEYLNVGPETIKSHLKHIRQKFNVSDSYSLLSRLNNLKFARNIHNSYY